MNRLLTDVLMKWGLPCMGYNDTFIRACQKLDVDYTPVWYMRQAGRYDPDYRKIKEKYSLLDICRQPELAAEVTLLPVRKLGVDAAILYSDIMNPVASLGVDFDIVKNVGPVIQHPIRSTSDIEKLKPIQVEEDLGHILETITILDRELTVPLITFAGAPFTIASYLIEGKPSRNYLRTKQLMYTAPEAWFMLMKKLGEMASTYLKAQIRAGAKAVQLFDSWVGALTPTDFEQYVLPTVQAIFESLKEENVPKIYFPGVSSGELLSSLLDLPVDVIGIDWRVPLRTARQRLNHRFAVQGNLDPTALMAPQHDLEQKAAAVIEEGIEENGYIFNLGHGLFPEASLEKLKELTQFVQEYSRKILSKKESTHTK